ncbi:hypothetical protein Nit79A3_2760 [Nitrosomonas sp. Is79A3]
MVVLKNRLKIIDDATSLPRGDIVRGSGGYRKVRWIQEGRGKMEQISIPSFLNRRRPMYNNIGLLFA